MYRIQDDEVVLSLKIQPNASRSEFAGAYGDEAIKVRIAAPAVEGAANKELIRLIAKQFKVPKSAVRIVSGETSKIKRVAFPLTEHFKAWRRTVIKDD